MGAIFEFHNITKDVVGKLPDNVQTPGDYPYYRNLDRRDESIVKEIFELLIVHNSWDKSDTIDAIGDVWMHIKYKDGKIIEYII